MHRRRSAEWLLKAYLGRRPKTNDEGLPRIVLYELCSGTGTLSRIARGGKKGGHPLVVDVVTVDNDPKRHATLVADLSTPEGRAEVAASMERHLEMGYVIVAHASPPCTEYSMAKTIGARDLESSNAFVRNVIDLMERYAVAWTLENPGTDHTHSLWRQPGFPELHPHALVDYCRYGNIIQKRTGLAMSSQHMLDTFPALLCTGKCHACVTDRGRVRHIGHFTLLSDDERIAMPHAFCTRILSALAAEATRMLQLYLDRFGDQLVATDLFPVRAVLNQKLGRDGRVMSLVRFVGYSEPAWVPKCMVDLDRMVARKRVGEIDARRPRPSYAAAFE